MPPEGSLFARDWHFRRLAQLPAVSPSVYPLRSLHYVRLNALCIFGVRRSA